MATWTSGKWAVNWLDRIFGPFDSKDQAEKVMKRVSKAPRAPQEYLVFPMFAPHFVNDIVKDYQDEHESGKEG